MSGETYHEPLDSLKPETLDRHRAIASLMEELEAVDWYQQRVDASGDQELKEILAHNRDEEKEHASMVLEWLRRHDAALAEQMRLHLFKEGDIVHHEEDEPEDAPRTDSGWLGLGSLKET